MRKLNVQDLFKFTNLMKAADLKKDLQPFFTKVRTEKEKKREMSQDDIKQLGIEVMLTIIEACGNTNVEGNFYRFLSGPLEMGEKEISNLSIEALFERLQQLAKENDLNRFFKSAANLTK